jgi:hypothetical protein
MLRFQLYRAFRAVVLLALVAVAVYGAALLIERHRIDPTELSDEYLHERATSTRHADFSEWIDKRPVFVEGEDCGGVQLLFECVGRILVRQPFGGAQAYYDPEADEIRIVGDQTVYEGTLPEPLRGNFYHVLRHEYGHAAFFDWLEEKEVDDHQALTILLSEPDAPPQDEMLPADLEPVIAEWTELDATVYIDPYFMSNFAEYIAESYARVVSGQSVPPRTEEFIFDAYRGERRG